MYSIKKIDGKEYNEAKGVSIATEFNKFKDVLFNEKIIRHKMKRIQSKKYKLGTYEIDNCQMIEFIRWLIFIMRLKKIVMIEKDYND